MGMRWWSIMVVCHPLVKDTEEAQWMGPRVEWDV